MHALPLAWPLAERRVVLIGDGELAARKLTLLAKAGARIDLYAWPSGQFVGAPERVSVFAGSPDQAALTDAALVIVAVTDGAAAESFSALARRARVPVNVVDRPDLSDFHVPAIVDRGVISIGIASGGVAPTLARDVRAAIEAAVPPSVEKLGQLALRLRDWVRAMVPDPAIRRGHWERVLRGAPGERARQGDLDGAVTLAQAAISSSAPAVGVVHIVGAGPGDPELLTLKALRLLQDADLIVHDRLIDPRILDLARRDATRLYVGKARADHAVPQDQIHELLIAAARQGKRVVRLKGGDPFVFGRGGEEVAALREAGIETHVTPGITAALGCAAHMQTPLTHRDSAHAVTFLTGHARGEDEEGEPDVDWRAFSSAAHTLVVYMGAARAGAVARRLTEVGRAGDTPVLIVENGTRENQRALLTDLAELPRAMAQFAPRGPALLIIGAVAAMADRAALIVQEAQGLAA
jgi:uroporphyrin-III C-methyltransferase/precorrin-2 dehydrogenase/sirohydrochlorin ferrochelatase